MVRVWKEWIVPVCHSKLKGKNGWNKVWSDEWIEWKKTSDRKIENGCLRQEKGSRKQNN